MNVAMILSGGVGKRLGSNIPKQYLTINGKMVIEYVINAIKASTKIEKILVVAHSPYAQMVEKKFNVDVCLGGIERNVTLKNGLDFINENYKCDKVMIFDAVRPLVTAELIDNYMDKLDTYDMVLTAQKITDSLGCYDMHEVYRDRYYLLQSPEAYKFDFLYKYFDSASKLTEVAQQLPEYMTKYLNFDFSDNLKITYRHDLFIAEQLLGLQDIKAKFDVKRFKEYLGKNYPIETEQWINDLPQMIDYLKFKWKFDDYTVNRNSHFGLIIKATSRQWGEVVVKLIPPFIGRFEGELDLYKEYESSGVMCPLYDYDKTFCALLLKCGQPGYCADFCEGNLAGLREFFDNLDKQLKSFKDEAYNDYRAILQSKLKSQAVGKNGERINNYVKKACELFEERFANEKTYLLLGDAHKYNLIQDGDKYVAIDPIGYKAPKEIEFARFIGTVLTEDIKNVESNLRKAINFFEKYSTKKKIVAALFIDVVFRLHNTTFENDDDILADKWLNCLQIIESWIN